MCAPRFVEDLKDEINRVLPSYLKEYPKDGYLTTIPAQYHYVINEEGDQVDILGVALAPLTIKTPRTAGDIQYSEKLVGYPSFRVESQGLTALQKIKRSAEALLLKCTAVENLDICVSEYTDLQYGTDCGVESVGRSVVFCKDVRGKMVKFALYFPDKVVLDITKLVVESKNPMDWLRENQVLGVQRGKKITLDAALSTPNTKQTKVLLCGETCAVLYADGTWEEGVVGEEKPVTGFSGGGWAEGEGKVGFRIA